MRERLTHGDPRHLGPERSTGRSQTDLPLEPRAPRRLSALPAKTPASHVGSQPHPPAGPALLQFVREIRGAAVAVDTAWRVVAWNIDAENLFGEPLAAGKGVPLGDVLNIRDLFGNPFPCFCGMVQAGRRGEPVKPFVVEVTAGSGDPLRVVVYADPVSHPRQFGGLVCRFRPDNRRRQVDRRGLDPANFLVRTGDSVVQRLPGVPTLSAAELKVLRLLASGKRADEVAETLCNSVLTVRNHIKHILKKLEARTQAQAILVAIRTGLV